MQMDEMNGTHIIAALRKKWIRHTVLADVLISFGTGLLPAVLFNKLFDWSYWWAIAYFLAGFLLLFFMHRVWMVNETAIAQLLDQTYPQLEESSNLLLQPLPSLNLLERLQYNRTTRALSAIPSPLEISRKIVTPVFILAVALAAGIVLYRVSFRHTTELFSTQPATQQHQKKPEVLLPQVAGITVSIAAPAYTGKKIRQQHTFNLQAEEGALVDWQLETNIAASQVKFIFNDSLQVALHSANNGHTQWHTDRKIDSTGFYQVSIDGKISELYKIETIKDYPPVVLLQSPKQYTTIDIGEIPQVKINTSISDDYGINDASVTATIASGSGEAVKFKEQKIALAGFNAGKTLYQLQQLLSLPQLGMQPGDELYFYVQATDNHQQQTRSGIYIVHLTDTAQLMNLEGLANNLTLKPEYFRSERQIIIETEQLLKDRDTISEESFKNRSNNLAIDQKLLRLRYGKFLGDENESGQDDTHELQDISNFSDADKVRDAYTDKHDNAEDATFFEPETKKQLQATLAEMWNAEIPLRTFSPQAALPFEYKALRLLKDLQQKSRAYVAKTNFKTTPLDLKKRLTGDISKIDPSILQKDIKQEPDIQLPVRKALALLEEIRTTGNAQHHSPEILQQANRRLHEKAIQQPALYLNAMESLKKIITALNTTTAIPANDILAAEHGLQRLLSLPDRLPSATKSSSAQALSKQYFDNLQKKQP
jgi:hypothetical protein